MHDYLHAKLHSNSEIQKFLRELFQNSEAIAKIVEDDIDAGVGGVLALPLLHRRRGFWNFEINNLHQQPCGAVEDRKV